MTGKISEEQIADGTINELEEELSLMTKSRKELALKLRIGRRIDLILDVFGEKYNPRKEKKDFSISDMLDNGAMQLTRGIFYGRPCDPEREFAMINYGGILGRLNGGNICYFELREGNHHAKEVVAFRNEEKWIRKVYSLYGLAQDTKHSTKQVSIQDRMMDRIKNNEQELGLLGIVGSRG